MAFQIVLILCFISVATFHESDALICYECGDSAITGDCVTDTSTMQAEFVKYNGTDRNTMASGSRKPMYKFIKECPSEADVCIIEKIEEQGLLQAYIRDCFLSSNNLSMPNVRFDNLVPYASRNLTSCIYDTQSKKVACVTICNTDFCNGPQIDSGAPYHYLHTSLALTAILFLLFCRT